MGDEQMGRSLLRVGVLPKQTDWEVDEGKEKKSQSSDHSFKETLKI